MKKSPGKVRIIGGQWRSRLITFPNIPGLRPTHDRIRETLFNWLAPHIEGAICLDLFAGSGAIGFEALSRGAGKVVFVDRKKALIESLHENAKALGVEGGYEIYLGEIPHRPPALGNGQFDIVFLDPPYHEGLIQKATHWLIAGDYIKPGAFVYMEAEKELVNLPIPGEWQIIKEGHTRTLNYFLIQTSGL